MCCKITDFFYRDLFGNGVSDEEVMWPQDVDVEVPEELQPFFSHVEYVWNTIGYGRGGRGIEQLTIIAILDLVLQI